MSAVSTSREDVVAALLSSSAEVSARNSSGQTALHYAVRSLVYARSFRATRCLMCWKPMHHTLQGGCTLAQLPCKPVWTCLHAGQ